MTGHCAFRSLRRDQQNDIIRFHPLMCSQLQQSDFAPSYLRGWRLADFRPLEMKFESVQEIQYAVRNDCFSARYGRPTSVELTNISIYCVVYSLQEVRGRDLTSQEKISLSKSGTLLSSHRTVFSRIDRRSRFEEHSRLLGHPARGSRNKGALLNGRALSI